MNNTPDDSNLDSNDPKYSSSNLHPSITGFVEGLSINEFSEKDVDQMIKAFKDITTLGEPYDINSVKDILNEIENNDLYDLASKIIGIFKDNLIRGTLDVINSYLVDMRKVMFEDEYGDEYRFLIDSDLDNVNMSDNRLIEVTKLIREFLISNGVKRSQEQLTREERVTEYSDLGEQVVISFENNLNAYLSSKGLGSREDLSNFISQVVSLYNAEKSTEVTELVSETVRGITDIVYKLLASKGSLKEIDEPYKNEDARVASKDIFLIAPGVKNKVIGQIQTEIDEYFAALAEGVIEGVKPHEKAGFLKFLQAIVRQNIPKMRNDEDSFSYQTPELPKLGALVDGSNK